MVRFVAYTVVTDTVMAYIVMMTCIWAQRRFIERVVAKMPREAPPTPLLPSDETRRLLWRMMHSDPKKRPTAADVLDDPWVAAGHPVGPGRLCETGEAAYTGTLASNELEVCQVGCGLGAI